MITIRSAWLVLFCGSAVLAATVRDDTTSGLIREATTWEGTISVVGNVTVDNGFTLTIEPGTRVEFQNRYRLEVNGALVARGTESDSIVFTIADTAGYGTGTHRAWRGIRFDHTDTANAYSFIEYCRLEYGRAEGSSPDRYGGAVFVRGFSRLAITHSVFRCDSAAYGGAVYLDSANVDIADCRFVDNGAYVGGGVYIFGAAPVVERCLFDANRAEFGGGLYCLQSSPDVYSCVFDGNAARTHGGGMLSNTRSWPQVYGCTFVNNTAREGGGHYTLLETGNTLDKPEIGCSIFWNNGDELGGDEATVTRCCVSGGAGGYLNIDVDPMLRDTAAGDYGLRIGSPCINAGGNPSIGHQDYVGNNRVFDDSMDIGAIEARCEVFNGQYYWHERWDADTVVVHHSVYVDERCALSVEAGTVVLFDSGGVKVRGAVVAQGTEDDSIVFMLPDLPYGFEGFTFDTIPFSFTDIPSEFAYCRFQGPGPIGRTAGLQVRNCVAPLSLSHCVFTGMSTVRNQVLTARSSAVSLTDCVFRGNKALSSGTGGAVCLIECQATTIERCVFENNEVAGVNPTGGALFIRDTDTHLSECTFAHNVAGLLGGALSLGWFIGDDSSDVVIDRCRFLGNVSENCGAFCMFGSQVTMTNSLLAGNYASDEAPSFGAPAIGAYGGSIALRNCTITGNTGPETRITLQRGADLTAVNCIFWNGGDEIAALDSATVAVTYSCVQSGHSGTGNLDVHPGFVDSLTGDFSLADTSVCINRGLDDTTGLGIGLFDLAGNARIAELIVDMGAFEHDPAVGIGTVRRTVAAGQRRQECWQVFDLRGRMVGRVDGPSRTVGRYLRTQGVMVLRGGVRGQARETAVHSVVAQ
ncbi:MAG: hypothetical protein GF331_24840 [Chitinivibrionales bacterium]|nr:hypothetical protein [Chitinivibrionales bacterium]